MTLVLNLENITYAVGWIWFISFILGTYLQYLDNEPIKWSFLEGVLFAWFLDMVLK